jgi:hypothetical protein
MKELLIKLHRLEDELVGAQVVNVLEITPTVRQMINRIECARQGLLEIIKYTEKILKGMRSQTDSKMEIDWGVK